MKKIVLITTSYLDAHTYKQEIGGIQTYIHDLAKTLVDSGAIVIIVQIVDKTIPPYCTHIDGSQIIFVPSKRRFNITSNQNAFHKIYKEFNGKETIFIIATDQMDIKSNANNVIQIQHGVAFDIPGYFIKGLWGTNRYLQNVNKLLRCLKNRKRINHVSNTVCVDYNFYNWYRTIGTINPENRISIIPNYSSTCITRNELERKLNNNYNNKTKKILFARRFVDYRGTLLFAKVIKKLLDERKDIEVTFAGNGFLKEKIVTMFSSDKRVNVSFFESKDSVRFHYDYDIAIIPTIYSEGTSLSLCEAMSAGCFPISTHVGGMTNIIIDKYNGRMASPYFDSLIKVIREVLNMDTKSFNTIVYNSYHTATSAFNKANWEQRWKELINI